MAAQFTMFMVCLVLSWVTLAVMVGTEKIKVKFKWYKHLHELLSVNPIYDRSGLANSTSNIDTSVLTLAPSTEMIESQDLIMPVVSQLNIVAINS